MLCDTCKNRLRHVCYVIFFLTFFLPKGLWEDSELKGWFSKAIPMVPSQVLHMRMLLITYFISLNNEIKRKNNYYLFMLILHVIKIIARFSFFFFCRMLLVLILMVNVI